MFKHFHYLLLILFFSGWSTFLDAQMTFKAYLTGRSEVQPVLSRGSGEITAVLTDSTLVLTGTFANLGTEMDTTIGGGSHIHRGYTGQNGPVMFALQPTFGADLTGGTYEAANNTFTLSAAQVQALMDRRYYVNLHSVGIPSGEIRGQLLPESEDYFAANLFGSNEAPPILSSGSGAVSLELNGTELVVTGSFQNLDGDFAANIAGGAHLHVGLAGTNGGIAVPLNATVDADLKGGIFEATNNTLTLDPDQIGLLDERRLYVNIHSSLYPGGELRGQVTGGNVQALFRAHLSGSSESAPVTSLADGVVLVEVSEDTSILSTGAFRNLSAALAINIGGGAHIHEGMAGRNGGVVVPLSADADANLLSGTFNAADNEEVMTADQVSSLYARRYYVNIHSENHPGGEIRGQLLPEGQAAFNAYLSSAYAVPEVFSGGSGDVKVELHGDQLVVSGSFNDLGSPLAVNIMGGAHLHLGLAGQTGAISFPLTATPDGNNLGGVFSAADNVFTLDSNQVKNLKARRYYVNMHSVQNTSGELRGQVLHQATTYFAAPLSGTSQPASVETDARGMLVVEVSGNQAFASGSFEGLSSELNVGIAGGAHIHEGLAGQSGGIDLFLNATADAGNLSGAFEVADNTLDITAGNVDTMLMRVNYVNIHSLNHPGGEIRGQLLPLATHYFTTTLRGINEVDINNSVATGDMKFEIIGNKLTAHGSFTGLESEFNPAIAGGAHLHIAMAGEDGPIAFPLTTTLEPDNLTGYFMAAENTFELDSAQIADLTNSNFYVNIHTVDIPSGELRGQVLKETNSFPAPETNITAPASGAALTIQGDPATPFTAEWLPGFEPDGNPQVYIWQLAADPDFTSIVFQTYTGTQNSFTTDFATVDALLAGAGLNVGDAITLYHRAFGSDGAVVNSGTSADVVLTRGVLSQPGGADVELDITADVTSYTQYVDVTYTMTVTNTGDSTATGVTVAAGLPAGMVHTSNFTNKGSYSLFFETWDVGSLAPGESGTLTLVLFPLINDSDITNFVQVMTQNEDDADSVPGNGTCCTPQEDDEAAVTVTGPQLPPSGGDTADLELFASADVAEYEIYVDVTYQLMLVNQGTDDAAGVTVEAGLPQGVVHTSNFATQGQYNLFFERWEVDFLAAGDTAYLDLVLFPLVEDVDITNFFQVLTSNQDDPDSTPGNGTCCLPQEDDEAVVTLMPDMMPDNPNSSQIAAFNFENFFGKAAAYPVPAEYEVTVKMVSKEKFTGKEVVIFDQSGSVIELERTDVQEGINEWRFDISDYRSGIYMVKVPGGEVLRFVKM